MPSQERSCDRRVYSLPRARVIQPCCSPLRMSLWIPGDGEPSEEVQALKNKLSIQDAQLASQQTQLMKQAQQLNEYQTSLNDVIHRLNQETQRSLQLEEDLKQKTDDYQNQCILSQNVDMALTGVRETLKAKDFEVKELQAFLDTVSRTSEENNTRSSKMEREKSILEARVRELEAEVRKKIPPNASTRRTASQPRSSSALDDKVKLMEKQLDDTRSTLSQTEANLRSTSQKLSQAQNDLVRVDNEKAALGKRMGSQITDLRASLEEKEAELQLIRKQVGDGSREDDLIKRIEEDEVKIAALESSLRETQGTHRLKAQMKAVEARLADEVKKVVEREERCIDLVREKEEGLDKLADARVEIQRLTEIVSEHNTRPMSSRATGTGTGVEPHAATPSLQSQPDETTIVYIERLLSAIDRLRAERDSLRRDVQFLESESRFAIESLEAKLSTSTMAATNSSESVTITARSRRIIKHIELVATASAVVINHLDSRHAQLQDELLAASNRYTDQQNRLQCNDRTMAQQTDRIRELEAQLKESTSNSQVVSEQRDDIEAQLTLRELQWEEERQDLNRLNQGNLDELGRQVTDLSRTLENVESERDSLALQVANLTSELQFAQQELTNAESRYSSLQFQQLSTMSTTEANRALRDQLKEMEMRVARRTEQIGIHQHDIRRLETNLRLQEERLGEMTTELETLAAQKDAMVEDCADAREARDAALSRVEALEMELETLDGKLEHSDKALVSLVAVFIQSVNQAKNTIRVMREKDARTADELHAAYGLQQTLVKTSEEDKRSFIALQKTLQESASGIRQMGLALAMSRIEVRNVTNALDGLKEERNRVETRLSELLACAQHDESPPSPAVTELEVSRREAAQHALRITELDTEILELRRDIETQAGENEVLLNQLSQYKEQLEASLSDKESQTTDKIAAEMALAKVESLHTQQIKALQQQVGTTADAMEQVRTKFASAQAEKEQMSRDFASIKQELEKRVESLLAEALQDNEAKEELSSLRRKQEDDLSRLRSDLQAARLEDEKAQERICALELSYQKKLDELAEVHDSHKAELARLNEEALKTKEKLKKDIAALDSELDRRSRDLVQSSEEVKQLKQDLQQLAKDRAQERTEHDQQMHLIEDQLQTAENTSKELRDRMNSVIKELDITHEELASVQKERLSLQESMTNVEAELQRSVSMTRFLESKIKESEETIATLSSERDMQREDFSHLEKSCKAAEVNLSLQGAQHKREMAELQRDLNALRSKPDLTAALVELEERNNEMEELLRKKCAEIEENDDKVLEILKDNKRLTTKVESLNRKVQNLQAKLSAAKASIPRPVYEVTEPKRSSLPTASAATPTRLIPPAPEPPSALSRSTLSTMTTRVTSTGSGISRPRTPERPFAHPTVFKAKSPDNRTSDPALEETGQVIGKKRRAPEDFEVCESLPPQGFTTESMPDGHNENRTPRVRRMLSGGFTGFTPVRRMHTVQPSPKRASSASTKTTSLIADVTNSPRGVSQGSGKRSWLGKIRGTASHTSARSVGSRTVSGKDDLT
ncbi:hypothetical protein AX15_000646 [Amanita polypyramis BW_CC]|nr:hypothetical protein AX15_000646 [Amanita polypyramis BW_CC]